MRMHPEAAIRPCDSPPNHAEAHPDKKLSHYGDLVKFYGDCRCRRCQRHNGSCVIHLTDNACLMCTGAREPCVFERDIKLTGAADQFAWDLLLLKTSSVDARQYLAAS